MRKIFWIYIFSGLVAYSADFYLNLEGVESITNFEDTELFYKGIGGVKGGGDNYSWEIAGKSEKDEIEEKITLYRAYGKLYLGNTTLTLGRENLSWGHSYLFNLTDVFFPIDIENPKNKMRDGVDFLGVNYEINDNSRVEGVVFKNHYDDKNFATRYSQILGKFQLIGNYFNYEAPMSQDVEKVVLEVKGDVGIGVWGQVEYSKMGENTYNNYVIGGDYTFEIGEKSIYTAVEGGISKSGGAVFLTYGVPVNELLTFTQSGVFSGGGKYINSGISYLFNDFFTLELGHNFYDNFNGIFGNEKIDKNEVVMKGKFYF